MGSGKNGTFDIVPDIQQWALIVCLKPGYTLPPAHEDLINSVYGKFIAGWYKFFRIQQWIVVLEAIEGHGLWDGKEVFGSLPKSTAYEGMIAVLTRATVRLSRLKNFWKHVASAAAPLSTTQGFIHSIGIGEVPWIKQATFSIWQSKQSMKNYAYQAHQHQAVIQKTRKENWYSEEMFVRFIVLESYGNLEAHNIVSPYLQNNLTAAATTNKD